MGQADQKSAREGSLVIHHPFYDLDSAPEILWLVIGASPISHSMRQASSSTSTAPYTAGIGTCGGSGTDVVRGRASAELARAHVLDQPLTQWADGIGTNGKLLSGLTTPQSSGLAERAIAQRFRALAANRRCTAP